MAEREVQDASKNSSASGLAGASMDASQQDKVAKLLPMVRACVRACVCVCVYVCVRVCTCVAEW